MVTVLGIESTAHTFGVGVVKNGKVLSNVKRSFTTSDGGGGMIPMEVAKFHFNNKNEIYFEALDCAGIKEEDVDAIAFSQGPGLAPCLLEGLKFAKELHGRLNKPLVPVNHCVAHLEVGRSVGARDPVLLYASGANTQVIAYASGKYRVFGETLDIGIGNFIDTFGRYAGLGFPAGPKIQEIASRGKNYIELPYSVKGMDVAFSGILTNLRQKLEKMNSYSPPLNLHSSLTNDVNVSALPLADSSRRVKLMQKSLKLDSSKLSSVSDIKLKKDIKNIKLDYTLEDLAFSMQETVFAMLVEVAERALAHTGKKELVLGGGVACNSRLQEMCKIMCKERGAKYFCPSRDLLVDNAAMIAYLGEIEFNSGIKYSGKSVVDLDIKPRERTDDVEVIWRD